MKLQKENFPLSVKDYLVTHEEFTLIFNSEKEMLLTDPQPTTNQLYKYYEEVEFYKLDYTGVNFSQNFNALYTELLKDDNDNKIFAFNGSTSKVVFNPAITEGDDTYTLEAYFMASQYKTQNVIDQMPSSSFGSRRAAMHLLGSRKGGFNGASNDVREVADYLIDNWEHWVIVANITANNLKIFRNGF